MSRQSVDCDTVAKLEIKPTESADHSRAAGFPTIVVKMF